MDLIPPLNLSFPSSATSGINATGSRFYVDGNGPWTVNLGGAGSAAGPSMNSAPTVAAPPHHWLLIAAAVVALLVLKK